MFNAVVAGNIGKDAETRQAGQSSVTNFSVAVEQRSKEGKKTQWVRCALWGKRGDSLRSHLTKGSRVAVSGELIVSMYNGNPSVDLNASDVTLLGGGQSGGGSNAPQQHQNSAPNTSTMDDEIPF